MAILASLKPIWFVTLILVGSAEDARQQRLVERSGRVAIGMTHAQVIDIMGRPDNAMKAKDFWQLAFLGFNSGQWYWGSAIDLGNIVVPDSPVLNPFPINLRILSYADHDLVICWGFDDRVTEIRRPQFDVPPIACDLLDSWLFVRDLALLLTGNQDGG